MSKPPAVWRWYQGYCVASALANFGLVPLGVWIAQHPRDATVLTNVEPETADALTQSFPMIGWLVVCSGAVFGIISLSLLFFPREPWVYVIHAINIVAGVMSCFCTPVCIPLLIFWLRPEVRAWFRKEVPVLRR